MNNQPPPDPWKWYEWLGLALLLAACLGALGTVVLILLFRLL